MFTQLIKKFIIIVITLTAALNLTACDKALAKQVRDNDNSVPSELLSQVNKTFQSNFIYGDWRFQGTIAFKQAINAYIQIPDELELSKSQQIQYIQQVICPAKEHTNLWMSVKDYPLHIHIYTNNKKETIEAKCLNPLA